MWWSSCRCSGSFRAARRLPLIAIPTWQVSDGRSWPALACCSAREPWEGRRQGYWQLRRLQALPCVSSSGWVFSPGTRSRSGTTRRNFGPVFLRGTPNLISSRTTSVFCSLSKASRLRRATTTGRPCRSGPTTLTPTSTGPMRSFARASPPRRSNITSAPCRSGRNTPAPTTTWASRSLGRANWPRRSSITSRPCTSSLTLRKPTTTGAWRSLIRVSTPRRSSTTGRPCRSRLTPPKSTPTGAMCSLSRASSPRRSNITGGHCKSTHPARSTLSGVLAWARRRRRRAGRAKEWSRPGLGSGRGAHPPRRQEAEELDAVPEPPCEHLPVPRHLAHDRKDLPRPEVEAPVERLHRGEDLGMGEVRVAQRASLDAPPVDELTPIEPAMLEGLTVHHGAGVGRCDRHLDRVGLELAGEADRLLDRLARLTGKPEDERAVDPDAERPGIPREPPRDVQADPLLHAVEDPLVARLVADEQEAETVVFQDLERLGRHVRLRVARPRDAEPAESARDRLGTRQVVGERVVVEEELAHLREVAPRQRDLAHDVPDRARPVPVAADGLGPQAEGALGPTAAPRVERHIGVKEVADDVVLDRQVALVDVHDERERVHVLERRPVRGVPDHAVVPVAHAEDAAQGVAPGHLLDREVELVARDEVDRGRGGERFLRTDGDVGADEPDAQTRVLRLERLRHPHVVREGRREGVEHGELIVAGERAHILQREPVGRRVDQPRVGDERGGLGEPRRVPERPHLPPRLVTGARAAVKALVRRRVQEERPHARETSTRFE